MHYHSDNDREIRDPDFFDELAACDNHADLTVPLPVVLSDQAARVFYALLQDLADNFYEHYSKQIQRAHRTLERQEEEFCRDQGVGAISAQERLPFDPDEIDGQIF